GPRATSSAVPASRRRTSRTDRSWWGWSPTAAAPRAPAPRCAMPTGARSARPPPARCPRRWATRSPWASCHRAPPRSAPSWGPTCAARTRRAASWTRPSAPATDLPPRRHHENLPPPRRTLPLSADLLSSKDHEWVRVESEGVALVRVTHYAAEQRGADVYVVL